MSYSLQDLCNHIGLNGELRNLRYIYENADGPPSLDPEHYPLPPLNKWSQIRPYSPSVGIYKGITPYILIDKNELVLLGANLVNRIEWDCDFTTDIDSPGLLNFYDSSIDKSYNHIAAPPSDTFDVFPCNENGVLVEDVYNGSTDNAGEEGYDHWINLLKIYLDKGNDERIGIPAVLDTSNTFSKFNVWMVPSNTSIPARTINNSYFIKDINTEDYNGRRIIYDTDGLGLEEGYYTFYPYIEIDGSLYAFPGQLNPQTIYITAVPSVTYIPVTGIHWSPGLNLLNRGTEITYLDFGLNASDTKAASVFLEAGEDGSETPTHGRLTVRRLSGSELIDIISYSNDGTIFNEVFDNEVFSDKGTTGCLIGLRSGNSGGIAILLAQAWDKKAGPFYKNLKIYIGGHDLVLDKYSLNLRVSYGEDITTTNVIALATPNLSENTYTWESENTNKLQIVNTEDFLEIYNGNTLYKSRCTIKGLIPTIFTGTSLNPIKLICKALDLERECNISIYNPVKSISLTPVGTQETPYELPIGVPTRIDVSMIGLHSSYESTDKTINWATNESVNPRIEFYINTNGVPYMLGKLETVTSLVLITATANDSIYNDYRPNNLLPQGQLWVKVVQGDTPYIPLTGVRWIPDSINTGVEITWIDLSNSATLYTYMTGEGGQTPTQAHIYISSLDSAIVSVSYRDDVIAPVDIMSHASGVALLSATASDPNNTFTKYLTVYVGGRDLNILETSITLYVYDSQIRNTDYYYDLDIRVSPTGGTYSTSSDNTGIATVNGDRVTAIAAGTTTVRAYGLEDKSDSCTVIVMRHIRLASISPQNITDLEKEGNRVSITAGFDPSTGIDNFVKWKISSNKVKLYTSLTGTTQVDTSNWTQIHTVYAEGINEGDCYVYFIARDGGRNIESLHCNITVVEPSTPSYSVTFSGYSHAINVGESFTLHVYVNGNEINPVANNWYDYEGYFDIEGLSTFRATNPGNNIIIRYKYDGEYYEACNATVTNNIAVSRINITESSLTVYTNHGSSSLTAYVYSSGSATPTNKTINWSSSNTSILNFGNNSNNALTESGNSVSLNPKTTSNSAITITAKSAENESITDTCSVYVREWNYVGSVTLRPTSATIYTGDSAYYAHEISITADTGNATNSGVTWSDSSNYIELVSSSESGAVYKAKSPTPSGTTAQIIATSIGLDSNGNHKTATCSITVLAEPVGISFTSSGRFTVNLGDTVTITYITTPSDASVTIDSYTINGDSNIIESFNNWVVTASRTNTGTAYFDVTVRVNNTTCYGSFSVTVTNSTNVEVLITPHSTEVMVGNTTLLRASVTGTTNSNVTWTSGNSSIASVNNSGTVTGKSCGSTSITATSLADLNKSDSCTVSVRNITIYRHRFSYDDDVVSSSFTFSATNTYIILRAKENLSDSWINVNNWSIKSESPSGAVTISADTEYSGWLHVSAKKSGNATLEVTYSNGISKTYNIVIT